MENSVYHVWMGQMVRVKTLLWVTQRIPETPRPWWR